MLDPMHSWAENLSLTTLLSLPPWVLFKSTRRLGSLKNPTNLLDTVGITNNSITFQSQATEYQVFQQNAKAESNITLNIERQIPGSISNSNNARDGFQSSHAGAIHSEDEPEHKTHTTISKEDVLTSLKNTYCPVLRHTITVLLNCQKARMQAHKIAEFKPGKVTESTQHVSQRLDSLERQDEGSQLLPKLYQVPQRRSNGRDGNANQSSSTSSDDDSRINFGIHNHVSLLNYEQRPQLKQSDLVLTHETIIPTISECAPIIVALKERSNVTNHNTVALVPNYSGMNLPMYTEEPARSNLNEQANVDRHIQKRYAIINGENTNSNAQQTEENIHISPNVLSATVIKQASGVAGLSCLDCNNVRSVGFPNSFGLGDKTLVEVVFGWNHIKTRWDPFECWDEFKFRRRRRIKNVDGCSDAKWLNMPQKQEESFSIILPPATDSASFKQGFDLDNHMSNLQNAIQRNDEFFDPNRPSSELGTRICFSK